MKLSELLNVLDEDENIQIRYKIHKNVKKVKEKNMENMNILDLEVRRISLNGCAILFVDVE